MAPWTAEKARDQRELQRSYAGFISRENAAAARLRESELVELPEGLDYATVGALGHEARQKLARVRPRTIGQAGRIPGLTPADLQILWTRSVRPRS